MTVCDGWYQMQVISPLPYQPSEPLQSQWPLLTVRSVMAQIILPQSPPSELLLPPYFNSSVSITGPNGLIAQFRSPRKTDTSMIFFSHLVDKGRRRAAAVRVSKSNKAFNPVMWSYWSFSAGAFPPFVTATKTKNNIFFPLCNILLLLFLIKPSLWKFSILSETAVEICWFFFKLRIIKCRFIPIIHLATHAIHLPWPYLIFRWSVGRFFLLWFHRLWLAAVQHSWHIPSNEHFTSGQGGEEGVQVSLKEEDEKRKNHKK